MATFVAMFGENKLYFKSNFVGKLYFRVRYRLCFSCFFSYQGHLPMNMRNTKKLYHSFGETPHPVKNDLLLTTKLSVLGYTGRSMNNFPFIFFNRFK